MAIIQRSVPISKMVSISWMDRDAQFATPGRLTADSYLISLCKPGDFPSDIMYKRITGIFLRGYSNYVYGSRIYTELFLGEVDELTATYNSVQYYTNKVSGTYKGSESIQSGYFNFSTGGLPVYINDLFGRLGWLSVQVSTHSIDTIYGDNPPSIVIACESEDVEAFVDGFPSAGFVQKDKDFTFRWGFRRESSVYAAFQQSSAVFRWRSSSSGAVHETILETADSLTIPAGTFTTDAFEWQVTATTTTGQTSTSPWYSITTVDSIPSSVAVYPDNTIVDATKASSFIWEHVIDTGTEQSAADLQISSNGSTWTSLAHVTGAASQYEVLPSTLPSGNLLWRVRTYNTDSVPGDWSVPLSFLSIGAPPVPVVSSEQTPRPLVSWQSDGQQAAEIAVGDWTMQFFGNRKSIKLPFYLADGSTNIRVRVQNKYGIWSDFGSYTLNVENVPSGAISLTVDASHEARLSWEDTGDSEEYLVYRNGVPIARTDGSGYVDALSIGSAEYFVRGIMSDSDNYTDSNTETVNIESAITRICAVSGGDWIDLPHTEIQLDTQTTNLQRDGTLRHFLGAEYPLLELSRFRSKTVSLSVATMDRSVVQRLEELSGDVVCLKTSRGEMVIGALLELNKYASAFYYNYSIKLQQIHYNEEVEL